MQQNTKQQIILPFNYIGTFKSQKLSNIYLSMVSCKLAIVFLLACNRSMVDK